MCIAPEPTLLRHGRATRLAHAALALSVLALAVSGLGLAGHLPGPLLSLLGGHARLGWLHRQFGLVFGVAVGTAFLLGPAALRRLLRDMCRLGRGEAAWLGGFARHCLAPSRYDPPFHDGRFDPAQRLVFALMLGSTGLLTASGAVLYLDPHGRRLLLAWAIRVHVAGAVALATALAVHIAIGSGLAPSHRGIARVVLGDGRVPVSLARRLWPRWTEGRLAAVASGETTPKDPPRRLAA